MPESARDLQSIYHRRFKPTAAYRNRVWKVLTGTFFNRWIAPDAAILDLGCGYGEFINNVLAGRKYAIDLNPDAPNHVAPDVKLFAQDSTLAWPLEANSLDVVFTSNFFEHLPDKSSLRLALRNAHRCLKPGGRLIAMGPNIKYLPGQYWDFFDHHIMLTEASLAEVLVLEGFVPEQVVPRFLPYTLANSPEYPIPLLRLYLALPWVWWLKGRQFLVIAAKSHTA